MHKVEIKPHVWMTYEDHWLGRQWTACSLQSSMRSDCSRFACSDREIGTTKEVFYYKTNYSGAAEPCRLIATGAPQG
jgi:hypothetical protein